MSSIYVIYALLMLLLINISMKLFEILNTAPSPAVDFMNAAADAWGGSSNDRTFHAMPGTSVELVPLSATDVYISTIYTYPDMRGAGNGTKVMQQLVDIADKTQTVLLLMPAPADDANKAALVKWYSRYGFVFSGRKMIRQPQ